MNIVITRIDGAVRVNPAPPYIVSYLQYQRRSFETVKWQRVNKYEVQLLHINDGSGGVITLQGFFQKICKLILRNTDTFTVVDNRTPLPPVNWAAVKKIGLRNYQIKPTIEFLQAAEKDSGSMICAGGWGKTILQMTTYAAWNSLNTIVAIPFRQVLRQTYSKFRQYFPKTHVGLLGDGHNDISQQVTISTFQSLQKASLEKCQLLLVDEMQGAAGEEIQKVLTSMKPIRVFGFTATDKGLFNRADKLLKGLFGERLIHVPYPDAEEQGAVVPGLVYMVKVPDTMSVTSQTLEGKIRQGIKRCQARNKLVGDIAKLVPDGWQTVIFVEHVADHLAYLYPSMPTGTKYLHRITSAKDAGIYAMKPKEQDVVLAEFAENNHQHLICTDAFKAGADIPNIRVVIQASGGSSEVEILQEAFRGSRTLPEKLQKGLGVSPKTHFVLVDFQDGHDPELEKMANRRREMYEKQGWKVVDVDTPQQIDWHNYSQSQTEMNL